MQGTMSRGEVERRVSLWLFRDFISSSSLVSNFGTSNDAAQFQAKIGFLPVVAGIKVL